MNPELQAQYQAALASCKLGREGFGIAGYVKAFTECDYYADQLLPYIQGNLHYVLDYIHEHFPQIGAYMPEGTFSSGSTAGSCRSRPRLSLTGSLLKR